MVAMASLSAFTVAAAPPRSTPTVSLGSCVPTRNSQFGVPKSADCFDHLALRRNCSRGGTRMRRLAAAEDDAPPAAEEQPAVSVPVSPSDTLTMFFQAEGTMSEAVIPTVWNALQGTNGISNLKVQVVEGIASVELRKETTIQATGVASSLVEAIQGAGFKLLTLNLSFADEEEILV